MWLFTRYGFYSVVQDKSDINRVQVRGRIQDDLNKLSDFAREKAGVELPAIISTEQADYAYRIVVPKPDWLKVAAVLASDINYPNFKNEVHGEADRDQAYLEVWSAMNELQGKRSRQGKR